LVRRSLLGALGLSVLLSALGVGQVLGSGESPLELLLVVAGTALAPHTARLGLVPAVGLGVTTAGQAALGDADPVFATFLSLLAVAYGLGRHATTPQVVVGITALAAAIGVMISQDPSLQRPVEVVIPAVYLLGSVAVGRVALARHRESLAALAAERDVADAREREALQLQRAAIAREMHDVVAHSLSLVVVQAEAAGAVAASDPDRARALVEDVALTGRQALQEMRRVLGVLRDGPEDRPLDPQPSLASVPDLLEGVRRSGTQVVEVLDPSAAEVRDPGLQLAAYRVVQEAVTNAVRHGRAASIEVSVRREVGEIVVEVVDDGVGGVSSGIGHGVKGMRERVQAYGGALSAGPRTDGPGWRVAATLPCPVAEALPR
jgi:signal transduction histidine kinase